MSATILDFGEQTSVEVVLASLAATPDPRTKQVLESLVRHLHAFVGDVEPTHQEWQYGIDFLTRAGALCDDARQEFVLLSDVLGVSSLVDAINNRNPRGATASSVLGPFHVVDSPPREMGDDISGGLDAGPACVVVGQVRSLDGTPVPGAIIDVWHADAEGFYDVQRPGERPRGHLRGLFITAADGRFWFRTVVPRWYPIPDDGPAGDVLHAAGRHPNRPAHIHFIAGAPRHNPLTTQVFVESSPYLDSDTVFGVRPELVRAASVTDDRRAAESYGVANPFRQLEFDIVLRPSVVDSQDGQR